MSVSSMISQVNQTKEVIRAKMDNYDQVIETLRAENNQMQLILDNGGQTSEVVRGQIQNVISNLEEAKNIIVTEEARLDNFIALLNR